MKIKIVKCQALLRGKLARIRFRQLRIKTKSTIIQKTLRMLMQRRKYLSAPAKGRFILNPRTSRIRGRSEQTEERSQPWAGCQEF